MSALARERAYSARLREAIREARRSLRIQARLLQRKDREIEELRARLRVRADSERLYAEHVEDEIQLEEWRKAGVIR